MSGKERGEGSRRGEGEDMGQHIKFRAKLPTPLGGKAELREGKDSHTSATFHVKRRRNIKKQTLGNFYNSKIFIFLKLC